MRTPYTVGSYLSTRPLIAVALLLKATLFAAPVDPLHEIPSRGLLTNNPTYFQDRSQYPARPNEAADGGLEQSPVPEIAFNALSMEDWFVGGCHIGDPPDTHGAVGTNYLVTMLNSQVRVQSRLGTNIQTTCLDPWWTNSPVGSALPIADPRIAYDPYYDRWIATVHADTGSSNSAVFLAVSRTSDPSTVGTNGWHFIRMKADPNDPPTVWVDQPTFGFNRHWVVIHGNMFTPLTGATLDRSHIWVFNKTNLYAGGTNYTLFVYRSQTNAGAIIPAITYDSELSTLYLLQNANGPQGYLRLFSITGPVGSETLNYVTNAVYIKKEGFTWADKPPSIDFFPQGGATEKLNPGDSRLHNVVYRKGSLWSTHHIFLPATNVTRSAIQWWQINPTNAVVVQCGRIDDSTGRKLYGVPSIAVNRLNDVLVGYSTFGTNQYPSAAYAFRAYYDRLNFLRPERLLRAGTATNKASGRWGDYSATVVDPLNHADLWTIQEHTATNALGIDIFNWQTVWAKVKVAFPVNDYFTNATALNPLDGWLTNFNYRAGKEPGETNHHANAGGASVWYTWVPTNSVQAIVQTAGSNFDTLLAVYTGSTVSNLTLVGSDYNSGLNGSSKVTFTATANTTYRIALDGYTGSSGCIVLNWSATLAPVIVQQPQSTNVIANANVLLSVQASGFLPLLYQWRHEGTNLPNATNTTYGITNVQFSHATNYVVVVTNNYGSITSSVAGVFVHGDSAARLTLISFNSTSAWFHVFGVTNRPYRIEVSTNLVNWTPIHTNWTSFWYTNLFSSNSPMRFFRAITNS